VNEENFLRQRFKAFYEKNFVSEPPALEQREFGIGSFGKKIANRHIAFVDAKSFNEFLRSEVPFYVSYSAAYYKRPEATPMLAKGLLKSDIVYEFDADDIKTACKLEHDSWRCSKCGVQGKGSIQNCTSCGSSVEAEEWVCPSCLEAVKKQVMGLLGFLENDFAFTDGISINFSGSKGYHIHLRSSAVQGLSQPARIELLDYLTANSLSLENLGFFESHCPKQREAFGWAKRLRSGLVGFLGKASADELAVAGGISSKSAAKLLEKKEKLLQKINDGILPEFLARKNKEFWRSLLEHLVEEQRLEVDRQTSVDIAKIIRVPETIHGGTGLIAKKLSLNNLSSFNPLAEALAFGDAPRKVFVKSAPRFFLKGEWFGPFKGQETELPEFAAVFLVARGSAELR
jgi:DNA primase small subunit